MIKFKKGDICRIISGNAADDYAKRYNLEGALVKIMRVHSDSAAFRYAGIFLCDTMAFSKNDELPFLEEELQIAEIKCPRYMKN